MTPMPTLASDRQAFVWDRIYVEMTAAAWGDQPLPAAAIAVAAAAEVGASRILDCACGDGRNLPALSRAAPLVIGSDVSGVALMHAGVRLHQAGIRNALLLRDDILASDFIENSFDVVVALEVLSHLTETTSALDELVRICRPGGIIVTDVFATTDATRGGRAEREFVDESGVYFRYYDRPQATALLDHPQVADVQVHALNWTDPPHGTYRPYPHVHQTWCLVARKA